MREFFVAYCMLQVFADNHLVEGETLVSGMEQQSEKPEFLPRSMQHATCNMQQKVS